MFLPDTNVLFAAVYQAHIHHYPANRWLMAAERYATCGLTQVGAFRLLLTKAATNNYPLEVADAHAVLADLANSERHVFLATCSALSEEFVGQTPGPKAAFDHYLVQIACSVDCKLATFDRALTNRWSAHTVLIQQA